MGEAKQRSGSVGRCIYCDSIVGLTREHVMPFGLGGDLVLSGASCSTCATETSRLELRLLRGHWWPYRLRLGMRSRRAGETIPDLAVSVQRADGTSVAATLPMVMQSVALVFEFDPPSILQGVVRDDEPNAPRVYLKPLGAFPSVVSLDGNAYQLKSNEKLEIPIHFDAADLCRFLAKVAHGFAISRRGFAACTEYFLPPIVLGKTSGAQTYVGGCDSRFVEGRLPGGGLHAMLDRVNNEFLTVYIQLFRDRGQPPPIYEVVVGRLAR